MKLCTSANSSLNCKVVPTFWQEGVQTSIVALGVGPLLPHLILSEPLFNGGVPVGGCMRIKHPDVYECTFESFAPRNVSSDV